jgi:hypothetical protein
MNTGYPGVPFNPSEREHRRQLSAMLNDQVNKGKFNCTLSVTLTASSTTTNLIDERIGATSFLSYMPLSAHAQAVQSSIYTVITGKGTATIHHTADANTDKNFTVVILG